MKLIDKAAIVAEIKGLIQANELYLSEPKTDEIRFQKVGTYSVLNDLLYFLNTLEVKEVDLEQEIHSWMEDNTCRGYCSASIPDTAEHFFELGLKAQKGE